VKVAGHWRYVSRAVDQFGQVIDVLVSARRDAMAARRRIRPSWMTCCRRRGTAMSNMATTALRLITAA
jgi:transposase-like protein